MYEVQFFATSSADWSEAVELIDADTNQPFDITGASFKLQVDGCGYPSLSASTAEGTIGTAGPGIISWSFPKTQMGPLRDERTYRVGLTMTTVDGATIQLLTGTLALLDGNVS